MKQNGKIMLIDELAKVILSSRIEIIRTLTKLSYINIV